MMSTASMSWRSLPWRPSSGKAAALGIACQRACKSVSEGLLRVSKPAGRERALAISGHQTLILFREGQAENNELAMRTSYVTVQVSMCLLTLYSSDTGFTGCTRVRNGSYDTRKM